MPCAGPVEPRVLQSTVNLVSSAQSQGIKVLQVGITDRTLIHTARNILANGFLQTECEWAFWMDSDMILEPRTIPLMLKYAKQLDAKMLTGIYYKRLGQHHPVLWRKTLKSADGKLVRTTASRYAHMTVFPGGVGGPPFKVDVSGFGCVLMHRSVLDALKKPYFRFDFFEEDGQQLEASEDFYFFVNAKEAGFDLWAIPELKCGHVGSAPVITHADMQIDMSKMTQMDMGEQPLMELAKGGVSK
jgi:hypothetical protein